MRHPYFIVTLLLASSYFCNAQFLHTPEELEEIILSKPEKFLLQETNNLSKEAFENCRGGIAQPSSQALQISNISILNDKLSNSSKKKIKKKNKKILKSKRIQDAQTINELCYNHFKLGNFDEALYYKLQLLDSKVKDIEDEYFLAKSYLETKKYNLALEHAFNAKVLLPYQAEIWGDHEKKILEELISDILYAKKRTYQNWSLQFSYCITNRDGKTYISFKSEPWKTYAICKSVWLEDPKHKTKMATISDQASWLVEEKECLLNTLVAYMRNETENADSKGLDHLARSLDENTVKEFIIYEKFVSMYFPKPDGPPTNDEIEKLRAYFMDAHSAAL